MFRAIVWAWRSGDRDIWVRIISTSATCNSCYRLPFLACRRWRTRLCWFGNIQPLCISYCLMPFGCWVKPKPIQFTSGSIATIGFLWQMLPRAAKALWASSYWLESVQQPSCVHPHSIDYFRGVMWQVDSTLTFLFVRFQADIMYTKVLQASGTRRRSNGSSYWSIGILTCPESWQQGRGTWFSTPAKLKLILDVLISSSIDFWRYAFTLVWSRIQLRLQYDHTRSWVDCELSGILKTSDVASFTLPAVAVWPDHWIIHYTYQYMDETTTMMKSGCTEIQQTRSPMWDLTIKQYSNTENDRCVAYLALCAIHTEPSLWLH